MLTLRCRLLGRFFETSRHVLEQTLAVHHTQDANAIGLDPVHQPIFVDEGFAPVGILELGDHASGIRETSILVRRLANFLDDPARVHRRS